MDECKPLPVALKRAWNLAGSTRRQAEMEASGADLFRKWFTARQGLTLVPLSAQLELFCPPDKPT